MRVISGDRKGHRLKAPKGMDVRPTEDKVKESLFNILTPLKKDAIVLDLFAGSGSIGIEFLSRSAKKAYFVDLSPKSIATIKENLNHTKLQDKSVIINRDAKRTLNILKENNVKFDYIYLDPPFRNEELLNKVLNTIFTYELLDINGVLIIEHETELLINEILFDYFYKYDFRNYGSKCISFFNIGVLGHEGDLSR